MKHMPGCGAAARPLLTLDELHAEGLRRAKQGHFVVYLYPHQEHMALALQVPFMRYAPIGRGHTAYARDAISQARGVLAPAPHQGPPHAQASPTSALARFTYKEYVLQMVDSISSVLGPHT
jgi:hypothetical protein